LFAERYREQSRIVATSDGTDITAGKRPAAEGTAGRRVSKRGHNSPPFADLATSSVLTTTLTGSHYRYDSDSWLTRLMNDPSGLCSKRGKPPEIKTKLLRREFAQAINYVI